MTPYRDGQFIKTQQTEDTATHETDVQEARKAEDICCFFFFFVCLVLMWSEFKFESEIEKMEEILFLTLKIFFLC